MSNYYLPAGYQFENYIIESVLGSGGFGITYLVRDISLDTKFAIKEYIPAEFAYREDNYFVVPKTEKDKDNFEWGLSSFLKEARTLVRFNDSENIVKVYRFFEANRTAYFVMEYIDGQTFTDLLKANKLNPNIIEKMFEGVLNGLKRIHNSDVLHKDIKPSNIMVRGSTPILIDFGSARENKPGTEHTRIITERYSPIEQYDPSQEVGFWSDIYSLSATFYRAVTGSAPPEASGRVIDDKCITLSTERPKGYSLEFLTLLDRGLALLPKDRPKDITNWQKNNKINFLANFKVKKPVNIGYRLFQGGFIISALFAFIAILNIIFPDLIQEQSTNVNKVLVQNAKVEKIIEKESDVYSRKKVGIKPIIKNFNVTGHQWKLININTEFKPLILNSKSTKGFLEIASQFPLRVRSKNSRKYSNPYLFKNGGTINLDDIGFSNGSRRLEIKSVKQSDNISIRFKID